MNILFICENYYPHYGGAEVLFKNLAEGYIQQGHHVTILTHRLKNTEKREILNGVIIHRVPTFHSRYLFSFLAVPRAISLAREHDLIQTTTFNGTLPASIAAKITQKPSCLTVHEIWINRWQEITGFGRIKSVVHNTVEKAIYKLPFDRYICVSNATKNDLLKQKINPSKTHTIYNGLDYNFWSREKVNEQEIKNLQKKFEIDKKFTYFSWGRPGQSKGFEYLLRAIPKVSRYNAKSQCVLMLSAKEKYPQKYQQLLNLAKNQDIARNLKIIEPLSMAELRTMLAAVHCVVIPSTSEGFGYAAVEACAMEKPVIVSNAGSLPEVISGKHLLFQSKNSDDLAQKIIALSKGNSKYKEKIKFSWSNTISSYLNLYNEVLRTKNPKP